MPEQQALLRLRTARVVSAIPPGLVPGLSHRGKRASPQSRRLRFAITASRSLGAESRSSSSVRSTGAKVSASSRSLSGITASLATRELACMTSPGRPGPACAHLIPGDEVAALDLDAELRIIIGSTQAAAPEGNEGEGIGQKPR